MSTLKVVRAVEQNSDGGGIAERLRQVESSFHAFIEQLPDAVLVHRDGRVIYLNKAMLRTLGYETPENVLGHSWADLIDADDLEFGATYRETRLRRNDGRVTVAEVASLSMPFEGAPATVLIARDLTERRQLQARLAQADRMASVGILAAGVAHEINNPLAYVLANLSFTAAELPLLLHVDAEVSGKMSEEPKEMHARRELALEVLKAVEQAREGASRVGQIVLDLKTFSRGGEEQLGATDVEAVMESAINMANKEIRHRARLTRDFQDCPLVHGSDSRLGQIFLNLLVNAAQAIPGGAVQDNEIRVVTRTDEESGRVVVEIHDTGSGISPENLSRMFEPFFTTKEVGVGTGLGLSICQGIVESLGGEITVESTLGRGSVFRVFLPQAAQGSQKELGSGVMDRPVIPGVRGKVLVIDDEPQIGDAIRRILSSEHDVVVFTRATDALMRIRAGERFDVILSDLMMPDLSGMAFHAALTKHAPHLVPGLVFFTAGAVTTEAKNFLEKASAPRLDKPFDLDRLRSIVRKQVARARLQRTHDKHL